MMWFHSCILLITTVGTLVLGLTIGASEPPGITLRLSADKSEILPFEPVTFEVTLENIGAQEVMLVNRALEYQVLGCCLFASWGSPRAEGPIMPGRPTGHPITPLPFRPGDKRQTQLRAALHSVHVRNGEQQIPTLFQEAGSYELEWRYEYSQYQMTSNPVKVTVRKPEPADMPAYRIMQDVAKVWNRNDPEAISKLALLLEKHPKSAFAKMAREYLEDLERRVGKYEANQQKWISEERDQNMAETCREIESDDLAAAKERMRVKLRFTMRPEIFELRGDLAAKEGNSEAAAWEYGLALRYKHPNGDAICEKMRKVDGRK